ncbi:MAG: sigma-54 dependent transcriptional regulator [Bacteroidota bacterium]
MKKLLIIDDDIDMCLLLNRFLTRKGFKVTEVHTCMDAWDHLQFNLPDLVICDVWLEDMDGISFLRKVKETMPELPFIFITAYDDIKTSATAIKYGAIDYVTKPLLPEDIAAIVQKALDKVKNNQKAHFHTEPSVSGIPDFYSGDTEIFRKLSRQIDLIAPTNYNVSIQGERGTGKDLVAREIHRRSFRRDKPFVVFNCSAYTGDMAAEALFGSEANAANDSEDQGIGYLELANGGTLLLNEVADLSPTAQAMLVKAIKSKKMTRQGGKPEIEIDVRFISASHESLWHAAHVGKLNEEAYHLLNDFTIDILPLRNRKDDIMLFAGHFLETANAELDKNTSGFSPEVEIIFKNHVWQDNLRELKNVVNKAVLISQSPVIDSGSLPAEICPFVKGPSFVSTQQMGVLS